VAELKKEIADLNAHNHQVESSIDEIYLEKQRKEERIQRLERDLADEKKKSERLLENMVTFLIHLFSFALFLLES
jgi:chromosome segregation ATPase